MNTATSKYLMGWREICKLGNDAART